jgi:hypothetical protein
MALLLVVSTLFISTLNSTSVVTIIRPDRIAMAADAKSIVGYRNGPVTLYICKIHESGNTFFAFSGMDQDDITGFSASVLAKRGEMLGMGIQVRAEKFAAEVKEPMLRSLQRQYRSAPREYGKIYGPIDNPVLEALFVGFEHDASVFTLVEVLRVEDAYGKPIGVSVRPLRGCPGNSCPTKEYPKVVYGGVRDEARAEYRRMGAIQDKRLNDDAATVQHLVGTEIAADPSRVAPPVAVLVIDSSGSRWRAEEKCGQDKKKPTNQPQRKPHP